MKKIIIEKFVELLNTMNYEDISVILLCEKCNTSRTTFYKYFKNIDDLFVELELEIMSDLSLIYRKNNHHTANELRSKDIAPDLYEMYEYIKNHKEFFTFFFSDNCPKTYMDKTIKMVSDGLTKSFSKYLEEKSARQAAIICTDFIIATAKSLITDDTINPKQLSILFKNIIVHLIYKKDMYF